MSYLRYAIGEILLVVIGILIAVAINDWNDGRKAQQGIEVLMDRFEKECYQNIGNADWDIGNVLRQDSIVRWMLSDSITIDDYYRYPDLGSQIVYRFSLNPQTEILERLLQLEEDLPAKYLPLIAHINSAKFWRDIEARNVESVYRSSMENLDFINMNFDWSRRNDSVSQHRRFQYFTENADFGNRLNTHWAKVTDYLGMIVYYKCANVQYLADLKVIRENADGATLRHLYDSLGLKRLEPLNCDFDYTSVRRTKRWETTMITNLRKEPIEVHVTNGSRPFLTVQPNSTIYTRALLQIAAAPFITVVSGGQCEAVYRENFNGYLVLD